MICMYTSLLHTVHTSLQALVTDSRWLKQGCHKTELRLSVWPSSFFSLSHSFFLSFFSSFLPSFLSSFLSISLLAFVHLFPCVLKLFKVKTENTVVLGE